MTAQRIKGQEISLLLVEDDVPLMEINDVRSFEMAAQLEIIKEGYLGEKTDRRDSIYRGFRGKMDVHFEGRQIIDFSRRIIDKAKRRVPGARINCKVTLAFPSGSRVRVLLKDLEFGEIPMGFGSRSDYGTISLEFEGEDYTII